MAGWEIPAAAMERKINELLQQAMFDYQGLYPSQILLANFSLDTVSLWALEKIRRGFRKILTPSISDLPHIPEFPGESVGQPNVYG